MEATSQRPKDKEGAISALNTTIEAMNLAKEISSITPAKAAFGVVSVLLTMLRVRFLLFCHDPFPIHTCLGLDDQRTGSHRAQFILCRYLQSA